nr:hypothetical protein [Tanacetum cinerariifolium]
LAHARGPGSSRRNRRTPWRGRSKQHLGGLAHEDFRRLRPDAVERLKALLEVTPVRARLPHTADRAAVFSQQPGSQRLQTRRGGLVIAPQHLHQLLMCATRQFARRVAAVLVDDNVPGLHRHLGTDSLAHQKAGQQPFEQCAFTAVHKINAQRVRCDVHAHATLLHPVCAVTSSGADEFDFSTSGEVAMERPARTSAPPLATSTAAGDGVPRQWPCQPYRPADRRAVPRQPVQGGCPASPLRAPEGVDAAEGFIQRDHVALGHDVQRLSSVEELVVVLHRRETVGVVGVIEQRSECSVDVQHEADALHLVLIERDRPLGVALPRPGVGAAGNAQDLAGLFTGGCPFVQNAQRCPQTHHTFGLGQVSGWDGNGHWSTCDWTEFGSIGATLLQLNPWTQCQVRSPMRRRGSSPMSEKHLLVAGASGVIGSAVVDSFAEAGWQVSTVGRSTTAPSHFPHLSADLLDPHTLASLKPSLKGVTHLFYSALKPNSDPGVEADENAAMLENLVAALRGAGADLERITFVQGGKIYGAHLGVYKTPAREDDSRHFPPNLYFRHEDFVKSLESEGIKWTALRPDIVIGHSIGSAMNLGNLIGLYGALCRETGTAMQFPGSDVAYRNVLVNVTSAELIGQAAVWAANRDFSAPSGNPIVNPRLPASLLFASVVTAWPAAHAADDVTLPEMQIQDSAVLDDGQSVGYQGKPSSSTTKLGLTNKQTPQAITTITRAQMNDFKMNGVKDALRSAPSVTVEQSESDRTEFTSRGFDIGSFEYDGMGMPFAQTILIGDLDMAEFEQIDVLHGANGLMSGTGNPSATVNFIRKRPTRDFQAQIDTSVGSWDSRRVQADVSGPLTETGNVRGRFIYAHDKGNSWMDRYSHEKNVAAGLLAFDLSDADTFTVGFTQHNSDSNGSTWGNLPLVDSNNNPIHYSSRSSNLLGEAKVSGPFSLFGRDHELTFGAAYGRTHQKAREYDAFESGYFNTSFAGILAGNSISPQFPFTRDSNTQNFTDRQKSLFAGARFSLADDLHWIAGARMLSADGTGDSYGTDHSQREHGKVTPYTGLVYDLTPQWSVYTSWTEIFNPQYGTVGVDGKVLAPLEGKSLEAGVKGSVMDDRLNLTAAVFKTHQSNVASADYIQVGSQFRYFTEDYESHGVELEASGEVLPGLDLLAGYTYVHIENDDGDRARRYVPAHALRGMASYRLPGLPQARIGTRVSWQSGIQNDTYSVIRQNAYALVDLMTSYDIDSNWSTALNFNNITDRKYLTSLYTGTASNYGAPRNLTASLTWRY